MDHLVPRSRGGTDTLENLALACRRCNERRYIFTTGRNPVTQQEDLTVLHPVREHWAAHFAWTADGQWIVETRATGRATVERLDLNDEQRHDDGFIRMSRASGSRVGGTHRRVILSSQMFCANAVHILPGTKEVSCHRDVCYYAHV